MGVGAAIVGGALIGGAASIYGAKKSASAQKDAAKKSGDAQLEMYYQSREDMLPWLSAGEWALGSAGSEGYWQEKYNNRGKLKKRHWVEAKPATGLMALLGARGENKTNLLRETPGYKFRLGEGQKSVERSAAARGGLLGGATQKALTRYGQDYASNEYDKQVNRLFTLAGAGQSAGNVLTQAGGTTGRGVGQSYLYGGDARASGYTNTANAVTGNVRSGMQDWMFYNAVR